MWALQAQHEMLVLRQMRSLYNDVQYRQFNQVFTHIALDLAFNGLNDTHVFTLTQSLCSLEVLKSHLHFLLFKSHHGVLQKANRIKAINCLHVVQEKSLMLNT